LDEFYARLKRVKDFHHRYPNRHVDGFDLELKGIVGDAEDEDLETEVEDRERSQLVVLLGLMCPAMSSLFSGEERYGLCLDLYTSHNQYNNLKNIKKRLQYLQYLDVFATVQNGLHAELLKEARHGKDYEAYVSSTHVFTYL
jgi:splicing factor 3A subunit 3